MLSRTLLNVGWRYLLRHPWQTVLMIVGITLGVAVMVAIDLANANVTKILANTAITITSDAVSVPLKQVIGIAVDAVSTSTNSEITAQLTVFRNGW